MYFVSVYFFVSILKRYVNFNCSGPEVLSQDLRRDEIRGWWWWWWVEYSQL